MKPKLFWDSSALLSAIMSTSEQSPGRRLLRLGETGTVDMRVSREVLKDCEQILRRRNPTLVLKLAVLMDQANLAITLDPDPQTIQRCLDMTGYLPDARVLAAAIECDADLFITHDTQHFLQNPLIGPPDTKLNVVTPSEALLWCREWLQAARNGNASSDIL